MSKRWFVVAVLVFASLMNVTVDAQEPQVLRPEARPVDADVPRADPAEEREALRGVSAGMRLEAATDVIGTPAADVSAGTFGANTGGGRYYFPDRVGIGTTTPAGSLSILNGPVGQEAVGSSTYGMNFSRANGTVESKTIVAAGDALGFSKYYGWDGSAYRLAAQISAQVDGAPGASDMPGRLAFFTTPDGSAALVERLRITSAGYVGIGTSTPASKLHVVGDSTFNGNATFTGTVTGGNIQAKFQDIAEWVPTTEQIPAGTVVVLDSGRNNHVQASTRAYDTSVAGVVSEQPGLILGEAGDAKAMIATTGRVRVKVDATRAAIAIGDLLVTSDKPGVAMKSLPIDLGGVPIHRPGTLIGKALEPLAGGTGEILVLLSLQ